MKLDKFLLGSLWIIVALLAMDFWLDTRFGFNMLLRGHWQYLANVQTSPDLAVDKWFYASLFVFAIILPLGLYFISRPSRRIVLERRTAPVPTLGNPGYLPSAMDTKAPPAMPTQPPARPPSITVPTHLLVTNPAEHISTRADAPLPTVAPEPEYAAKASDIEPDVQDAVASAGYVLKNPPHIGDAPLSVWAVGTDETLVVGMVAGTYQEPLRKLNDWLEQVRTLISDTLDGSVQIRILPFMFIDGKITNRDEADALARSYGIGIFDDIASLRNWFAENRNRPLKEDEREDFEAYSEYINTVAEYFNNK